MKGTDNDRSAQHDSPGPISLARAQTFVVRAWLEPQSNAAPRLRGIVTELGGRMLGAFETVERLAELVERGGAAQPSAPESFLLPPLNYPEDDDA